MTKDELYMQRALDLAAFGGVDVAPNPMVGAVIVHNDSIIGEGYHQKFGGPHAEVNAVAAVQNPELLKESTIYVTLEPCAHFGKTPPCADLIVKHQFKRVVVATIDPFGAVAGKGIKKIEDAGIEVVSEVLGDQARQINKRFFTFHNKKRPYITLKWAQSRDGFIDINRITGEKGVFWISAPETKVFTHQLRANEQAILVGKNTVIVDNPGLDVRAVSGKNPVRLVLDQHASLAGDYKIFTDNGKTIVFNRTKNDTQGNVEYVKLDDWTLESVFEELYKKGISSVLIEGGKKIHESFIAQNYWDEAYVIVGQNKLNEGVEAPKINRVNNQEITFGGDRILHYKNEKS